MPPSFQPFHEAVGLEDQAPLLAAVEALLMPLARLTIARGLPFFAVQELLKQAYIRAAHQEIMATHTLPVSARVVSRISTITGINRREVTRLLHAAQTPRTHKKVSVAAEVFTRWRSDSQWLNAAGQPRSLPRTGPAPSFEVLARAITQDVHPRSVLEELCRIGLAKLDKSNDQVSLLQEAFVPRGDWQRMLAFLGENVGDHLQAAVDNVLTDGSHHFEQAVFADELSVEALTLLNEHAKKYWQKILKEMVPLLEHAIATNKQAEQRQNYRIRLGLFTYHEPITTAQPNQLATCLPCVDQQATSTPTIAKAVKEVKAVKSAQSTIKKVHTTGRRA